MGSDRPVIDSSEQAAALVSSVLDCENTEVKRLQANVNVRGAQALVFQFRFLQCKDIT